MIDIKKISEVPAPAGAFAKLGLNQGIFKRLEPLTGPSFWAIKYVVQVGDYEYNGAIFAPGDQLYNLKGERINSSHPDWQDTLDRKETECCSLFWHILKVIGKHINKETKFLQMKNTPANSFKEWASQFTDVLFSKELNIPVDIFIENSVNKKDGKTYKTLPQVFYEGEFICPQTNDTWTPKIDPVNGLTYTNERGELHPFKRSVKYIESEKYTINLNGQNTPNTVKTTTAPTSTGNSTATAGTWDLF